MCFMFVLISVSSTGQVGLGVGSWPSNRATEGSNPKGTRLYFVILLRNVEKNSFFCVYGVGVCVNVCGVVWFVVCFLRLGVVTFVLSVMRAVGGCSFMGSVCVSLCRGCVYCTPNCYSECGVLCYL